MQVNFDLSRLDEGVLDECKNFMATLQSGIPVFAAKFQSWLAEERTRRQKAAQGEPAEPVAMWIPLLATDASTIVTGNFRELWLGIRLQLRIEILKERYADVLQMGFLAWLRADIQLAHPESFAKVTGIIP